MSIKQDTSEVSVGILTFHNGFNCGAFLQAFALQEVTKSLGFKSQVIDYKAPHHSYFEYRFLFVTKRLRIFFGNIKKLIKFKQAHKLFNLSRSVNKISDFSDLKYDAVIYGSDEIWNYSNSIVKIDPAYFGVGIKVKTKIAYAPSCGSLEQDTDVPLELQNGWKSFSSVSVRDLNTKKLIEKYTDKPAYIVLDPTFLIDFSSYEKKCTEKDFILIYTTGFSLELQKRVKDYAVSKGKRLISIGYVDSFCDLNIIGIGPFEFLGYFRAASEVITNTLHGTIFSVKYNKPLAIISDSYRRNKLATIIEMFDLERNIIPCNGAGLNECLEGAIDYKKINNKITDNIKISKDFLLEALENV